jgi:hypothetical protein
MPVYENRATGAILGDSGPLWPILGFSGLFLSKYAVYKGFLALQNILFTVSPYQMGTFALCPFSLG